MTKPNTNALNSWKPSATEELLLKATLLQGEAAKDAWTHLRSVIDLDNASGQFFWLLPSLYRSLEQQQISDVDLGRLKGIYRYTWMKNQLIAEEVVHILRQLQEAAIPHMVTGDLALLYRYADDPGLFPIGISEIAIPPTLHQKAIEVLSKLGWTSEPVPPSRLPLLRGLKLRNTQGSELYLRWHIVPQSCWPGADDAFWQNNAPIVLNEVNTRVLDPSSELLRVITEATWQGSNPNPMYATWIVRTMTILTAAGQGFNWETFCHQANKHHVAAASFMALSYLNTAYYVIPTSILNELASADRNLQNSHDYTMPHYKLFGGIRRHWHRHSLYTHTATLSQKALRFPAYLQSWWGLANRWQLPIHILRVGLRKVKNRR
jgi:hypothetical protein